MSATRVRDLAHGHRVQHELLVEERLERTTQKGDPFWVLTLRDASGSIETAPVWVDKASWIEGAERGKVVQAVGDVSLYKEKRQLALTAPLRVLPNGAERVEAFLPRVPFGVEKLWARVDTLRAAIKSPALAEAVALFFGDDAFRVRFERTPGAVRGHHAKLGGLLLHVVEVATIGRAMAETMRADADLVVAGALLHDIGKVETYTVDARGFDYAPTQVLVGHVVQGAFMFTERVHAARRDGSCTLDDAQLLELQHLILSHHGSLEYGSPVPPATTEAELLHWADETSAKGDAMTSSLGDDELFPGGASVTPRKAWQLDRKLWRRPAGLWGAEDGG